MMCLPRLGVGTMVKIGIRLLNSSSLVEGCVVPVTMVTRIAGLERLLIWCRLCNVGAIARGYMETA